MLRPLSPSLAPIVVLMALTASAFADGWEAIPTTELIARSRFIGVGKLSIDGKSDDGWLKGTLTFSEKIYSGIGDVKSYPLRIAPKTEPGKMQNWPSGKHGVWFILKTGDAYEPVNHPACWLDESQAQAVANQVYAAANKAYDEAKKQASQASQSSTTQQSGGDGSDSDRSVAAYAAMAAAAETARNTPYQDKAKQSERFYDQVMRMMEQAGIKPPFGRELTDPKKQDEFFQQTKQLFGPAGAAMGDLPGQGDPSRAGKLSAAQNNVGSLYLELVKNTIGSKNPAESLQKMGPISLDIPENAASPAGKNTPPGPGASPFPGPGGPLGGGPGGKGNPPAGGPAPAGGGKAPQFQIPQSALGQVPAGGSRKQMLAALSNHSAAGSPGGPKSPSPSPSPRGGGSPGGPRGPSGGGPGGPKPGPR